MTKQRVGVVFGGPSREHGVSFSSGRCLLENLPKDRYQAVPLFVGKEGLFLSPEESAAEMDRYFAKPPRERLLEGIEPGGPPAPSASRVESFSRAMAAARPDVLFPIIHGTYGEDGVVQGLFEAMNVPYVGCGVAASAVGMDKVLMKAVFASAGLPQVHYDVVTRRAWRGAGGHHMIEERLDMLPLPIFVKPACAGSSVGVSKVKDYAALPRAIEDALQYDDKALVEEGLDAREIECSVLEGEEGGPTQASVPGEIIPGHEFYDYEDKYIDDKSKSVIPADVPDAVREQVRALAVSAFDALGGAGFSRVDFFLDRKSGQVFLNEINTLPGFTPISMFPKMWEASGLSLASLLDRLVRSAFQRPIRGT